MKFVTVYQTFSSAEAQIIRSRLETAEFLVNVNHELASINMEGYSLATGGILVQVPEDQADEARALIHSDPPEL
jgi:hypothetical protein